MGSTASIANPAGVWGSTTQALGQGYIQEYVAAATITEKTIVALSTTAGQIVPCATNQSVASVVGIASTGAASGGTCMVTILGPVFSVAKSTAAADNFAQWDRVTFSATTTASAALLASTAAITQQKDIGLVVGLVLAAATTGATTVDVLVQRW